MNWEQTYGSISEGIYEGTKEVIYGIEETSETDRNCEANGKEFIEEAMGKLLKVTYESNWEVNEKEFMRLKVYRWSIGLIGAHTKLT